MIRCPICHRHSKPVQDHNHRTGALRGRICRTCNVGLGMLRDDPQTITRAARYLYKHHAPRLPHPIRNVVIDADFRPAQEALAFFRLPRRCP